MEHFSDSCGGIIGWLNSANSYTAFAEGWGLYAENPLIAEDTDTYLKEPMQKFGMLQWQVNTYLLLTEFEVRTVRYRPIFSLRLMAQCRSRGATGHNLHYGPRKRG